MNDKKDKKKDVAAVSTYADHEVILPPNKLKKAVQKVKPGTKIDSIRWRAPKPRWRSCRTTFRNGWNRKANGLARAATT